jgi:hypothetical protein
MGSITRGLSNNITTGGVILPAGITNSSVSAVTAFSGVSGGTLTLLSTQTASNSATISFTTGLDSTYDEYQFKFIDIHPRTDNVNFTFNLSTDSGSNYNVTKTTTVFTAYHDEGDATTALVYADGQDLAQSTGYQQIANVIGNDSKKCTAGSMQLFNPSSTTYVKHFISRTSRMSAVFTTNYMADFFVAGYGNTTSAINAIQFKMDSGNFDGIIKMYGVKKS